MVHSSKSLKLWEIKRSSCIIVYLLNLKLEMMYNTQPLKVEVKRYCIVASLLLWKLRDDEYY